MLDLLILLLRMLLFLAGGYIVVFTLMSAIRSFVLPRGDNVFLTRVIFVTINRLYRFRARKAASYEERDRILALFPPVALLTMPVVWLTLIVIAYTLIYLAMDVGSLYDCLRLSGSTLFTLGFFVGREVVADNIFITLLEFTQATIGLGLTAILISYLPTMYSAFSQRETLVTLLEVRANTPPSAVDLIIRAHGIRGLDYLSELWPDWEVWFAQLEESHTSLFAITLFRSPHPQRSWITAAGAVLDAASLMSSAVDVPRTPEAQLMIRSGFVALRHIADFFRIPYDPDPHFPDPISITREEFEEALDQLAKEGVPIREDRDQAWKDFAGWRVNYDTVLLGLCEMIAAPYAPWSSDRGLSRSVFKLMTEQNTRLS